VAVFDDLNSRTQALISEQLKLRWTTPAMAANLQAAAAATTRLGATLKLSVKTGNGTPPSAGRKTDVLSLGVPVSAKAAKSISVGVSLGVGISASASLAAQITAGLYTAISGLGTLRRELDTYNANCRAVSGTNGVMPPGQHIEQVGVNRALRGFNGNLSECQAKANAAAAAVPTSPIAAKLHQPRMGAWQSDLDLDVSEIPTGKVKFQLDDLEFTGTVLPEQSGLDGVRGKCRVVGGNGHLNRIIDAHSYSGGSGTTVGIVVRDILKACGEDLSDLSDADALATPLPRWHVVSGKASDALTALAEATDTAWRVQRDGTIWFGAEQWPEVAPEGQILHEAWADGHVTLASETPNMVPGVVFQGQRIEHVTHDYGTTLRTHLRTPGGSAVNALSALARLPRQIDFSREYPCKVVTQNPDGTLQLLPDDDVMKSRGLDHVPILTGLPGFKVKVKNGARCTLTFAAGDPMRPRVLGWELDPDSVESVSMVAGGREAQIARLGDPVTVFIQPAVPIPITGTVNGLPLVGLATIATPVVGVINGGNPLFKA
jgi:hypothetical protein